MSNKKTVFPEEVELSEIVLEKTNHAFEMIQQEDIDSMKRTNTKGNKSFRAQAAAIVGVCILAVSSISAAAAIRHHWGRGMDGNIQADDTQQQILTEKNVAKVYREEPDSASPAVTDNGVTIAPDTVIVDDRFAYMIFRISGYRATDGMEPGFETVTVYQGDDPAADGAWVNMSGTMYNGIVSDENGAPMYEDGASVEKNENGSVICHYTDSHGDMEYMIRASVADENDSLLGKTLHVDFKNLGTLSKAAFTSEVAGHWNFDIILSDVGSTQNIMVGQKVEGTDFTIEDISISPISIKVNYSVDTAPAEKEDDPDIPEVKGVVLKDGTKIPYLIGGSGVGYTDNSKSGAYQIAGYNRVIDVDEVAALIVLPSSGSETVKIPIAK